MLQNVLDISPGIEIEISACGTKVTSNVNTNTCKYVTHLAYQLFKASLKHYNIYPKQL